MTDKNYTPLEVKVIAKSLIENGYSSRKVESILGIDHNTALRYAEQPTPEEMRQYETIFNAYIAENKQRGIKIVHERLLELIPKERRIDQVVKAGEFLEGKSNANLTQINVGKEMSVQFEKI